MRRSKSFPGTRFVPMNMRCSKRCANPERRTGSSFEPTRYQTFTAATGSEWSSWRITVSPFSSLYFSYFSSCARAAAGRASTRQRAIVERTGPPVRSEILRPRITERAMAIAHGGLLESRLEGAAALLNEWRSVLEERIADGVAPSWAVSRGWDEFL